VGEAKYFVFVARKGGGGGGTGEKKKRYREEGGGGGGGGGRRVVVRRRKKLKAKLNGRRNPPLPRPSRSFCPLQQPRAPSPFLFIAPFFRPTKLLFKSDFQPVVNNATNT